MEAIKSHLNEIALMSAIILTSFSQLLLRLGARDKIKTRAIFINMSTISGYIFFGAVIVLMIFAMQQIQLKTAMAWNALTYIITPVLGSVLIGEPLDARIFVGSGVIVTGLLIFVL